MKIQEMCLAAYGPFTDQTLNFDEAGLHIVYGPNEAGKSSALRALTALLYGVETRTLDNFLHANIDLRIGGVLQKADGQTITFIRRKGSKNTLLTKEGDALDDLALDPFLQGVTPELFETLFGIDHPALVRGGKEILEQKGEVGQALFSAALGSPALHEVLAKLDDEADALFRPSASKKVINAALREYGALKKEIKESSLSSREWNEKYQALAQTTKDLEDIQSDLNRKRSDVHRLQRIQRALPKLATRRRLKEKLESLGDVVVLAENFSDRHQQTAKELEAAKILVRSALPRLAAFTKQLEGYVINQELLDQAEIIEDLHTRLGGHRKALQDRPHREADRLLQLNGAESLLKEVRPDLKLADIEELRPVFARRQAITELGNQKAVLISNVEKAEESRRVIDGRLKSARQNLEDLAESSPSDALHSAISNARKLGDVDTTIQTSESNLAGLQTDCKAKLSRLTLWEGELEAIPALQLPNRESINHFETVYDELRIRLQRLEEKNETATEAAQDTAFRLDEIQLAGAVPTEVDLEGVRAQREQVWQLLRRQWIDEEDVSAEAREVLTEESTLPEAFESRVTEADELSDRLRREADRVQQVVTLQAKQNAEKDLSETITTESEVYEKEQAQFESDWMALWAPCQVSPRTPREMRAWLEDVEQLRSQVEQLNTLRRTTAEQTETRQSHIAALNQQLEALGVAAVTSEGLESVLGVCESVAQKLDEANQAQEVLTKEVKGHECELETLTEAHRLVAEKLETWQIAWRELLEGFGLQGDYSPKEMSEFVEKVRDMFAKQEAAGDLAIRIKAIDDDAKTFSDQVMSLKESIAPELSDMPIEDSVLKLNSLLTKNRSNMTSREQIRDQLTETQGEVDNSEVMITAMKEQLGSLSIEAKCDSPSELEEAERKSAEYLQTKDAISTIEQELLDIGEGMAVADLESETEGVNPDELPGHIEALNEEIKDDLDPQSTQLAEEKGSLSTELALMDGSDQAAELADEAQSILASVRSDAERYVRVKLAGKILRNQIEKYRKENQGPLIKRASEHFATLTRGSFSELMTDFNDKDEPVLMGIRPDGESVLVEGMSSGTRDQLYLALRLASLEKYMVSAEPMPFIVDDVLVDFDDERSQAALGALSTLAESTQVIVFTHHMQVVEQANNLTGPVQIHTL